MSNPVYTNFATTTLGSLVSPVDVALTVTTGDGALFPVTAGGNWFYCVLSLGVSREIVKVTNRTGDVFTVLRGQDGTTAQSWTSGAKLDLRTVAASIVDERSTSTPNLTGPIAATAGVTAVTAQTGTGTTFAMQSSPNFLGAPTAPTALVSVNSTQIATTAFVQGLQGWVNAATYGATPSLVPDQATAINNALSLSPAGSIVVLAPGAYRVASTITIPVGKTLMGLSYAADAGNSGQLGAELHFDATVGTCISASGGGAAGRIAIRGITVYRDGAYPVTPPVGSIGILVTGSNDPLIEDVYVFRQETGVKLSGCLGAALNRVVTTQITQTHLWIASSQETHIHQCRMGKNGGLDLNCSQYYRIGGTSDTILCSDTNHNQSAGNVARMILWDTLTSGNGIMRWVNCHFEVPTGTAHLMSQTATANAYRVTFIGSTLNFSGDFCDGTIPSGFLVDFRLISAEFVLPALNLAAPSHVEIAACDFITASNLSAGSGSISSTFSNNLSISGAATGLLLDVSVVGTLTNTMTGSYWLRQPSDAVPTTFTPTLDFVTHGNLAVTYTNQIGWVIKNGRMRTAFGLVSGTATYTTAAGTALIAGFPEAHSLTADARSAISGQGITKANYTSFFLDMASGATYAQLVGLGSGQPEAAVTTLNIASGTVFGFSFMHTWVAPN